tara:strand:+ start:936 stop:1451 length:516 start_codon:yes stop_codon:yes gene_type:complete
MALNEKQEKFAQSYILHRNATEAAKSAGYSAASAANQGYRLINNEEVAERVRELENELVTNVDVIEEIENQYTFARANGHTNSALKALELLSRIRGNNSDMGGSLDEDSLETGIVQCLNILGADKVYTLLNKCDFMEDEEEESVDEEDSSEEVQEETEIPTSWGEATTNME